MSFGLNTLTAGNRYHGFFAGQIFLLRKLKMSSAKYVLSALNK